MNFEIIDEPIRFQLHGVSGTVENENYGEVGFQLMNVLWPTVKASGLSTKGVNHWVYMPDQRMFAGVELRNPTETTNTNSTQTKPLEPLEFELPRYLKHIHIGPYQALPQTWKTLKATLAAHGEAIGSLSLEIYGHHCDDPSKLETTILIGLRPRRDPNADTIDHSAFASLYAGQPAWEIGRPQRALLDAADRIKGSVLDSGCGTGETALFLAGRGHTVTGVDFLAEPIAIANQKARERGLSATFLVKDALSLNSWSERFDSVIDSGLFHVFSDTDRARYVEGLATVLKPSGRLFLVCFSDAEPGTQGPRRVSRQELEAAFARGWTIETLDATQFEVRSDLKGIRFSDGGPKAWFVVAKRLGG
ncbi:MAG: methyltransferase domain-containing protein [Gemmataceae bacterium]